MKKIQNIKRSENASNFFYELNETGTNYWWFYFDGGNNDDGSKVTCEQEALLADQIYKRLSCHDELVEALEGLLAYLPDGVGGNDMHRHPLNHAKFALAKAIGE